MRAMDAVMAWARRPTSKRTATILAMTAAGLYVAMLIALTIVSLANDHFGLAAFFVAAATVFVLVLYRFRRVAMRTRETIGKVGYALAAALGAFLALLYLIDGRVGFAVLWLVIASFWAYGACGIWRGWRGWTRAPEESHS